MTASPPQPTFTPSVHLSVVIPLFNEAENVQPLYDAVRRSLVELGRTYEIVFVDDGSQDETLDLLRTVQKQDPAVRVVSFRRNFGQTSAMRAGICAARGSTIVTMDGDLQNDPQDITQLIARIDQGDDLVLGWRKHRQDPLWSRTLPSRIANTLIGKITGVNVHDSGCSLKAYRASMIKQVPLYSEMHRFIPAMSTLRSAKISEVVVNHFARQRGQSKYGLSRVGKVLLDVIAIKMLISFRYQPLRYFAWLATPCFALSLAIAGIDLSQWWNGEDATFLVHPITSLLLFYLGAHLVLVGLLAELIVRSGISSPSPPQHRVDHVN